MIDQDKSKQELIEELAEMRRRVAVLETADTERKQAEAALRESEERYRLLSELVPHPVWRSDAQGRQIDCNRRWQEYTGQTPEEAQGDGWMKALHPDDRAWAVQRKREDVAGGELYQAEYRLRRASDNSYHWHLARAIPWRDADGTILGWFGSAMNIEAQKQAQEALAEREARLLEAQEVASLGFYFWDIAADRWTSSPVLDRIFGIPADYERTIGGWANLVHPDERQETLDHLLKKVVGEKKPCDREYRIVRYGDKQVRWVHGLGRLQFNTDGQPVSMLGTIRDITERKQAQGELAKSKAVLQAAIDCLPFNFFAIGLDGRYMLQNTVSKTQQRADAIGKLPEEVCPNKHDLAIWLDNNRRAFAGEKVEGEVTLSLGGEERFYYNVIAPIRDGEDLYGILGVNIDITERKRAEAALQEAHDELEERVQKRTAELAKATEDLRQSHDELRAIYDGMYDGMLVADIETKRFFAANAAMARMLGYSETELAFLSVKDIHPPADLPFVVEQFHGLAEGKIQVSEDIPLLRKDGSVFFARVTSSKVAHDGRPCLVGFFRDVTERKLAEEALAKERHSLWNMLQASDHERQIISYEIHDGLAQYLAAAGMQFQACDSLRENMPNEAAKAYETAVELVRQAHAESRRLINEVRPPVIDEIGLETAISHLVHEQRKRGGPKIECHSDVEFGKLASILENALYRIAQEALTNACKHSKSKNVTVTLVQEGQDVRLAVRDWGIGFDPESVKEGHFGLEGIRQRARLLGGRLTIESSPDSGTLLEVVVPVLEKPAEG